MHAILGQGEYMGKYLHMDHFSRSYNREMQGRDYVTDYVDVHVALGLGVRIGSAAVVSPLGNSYMYVNHK
jgi:hypothetical protein